MKRSLLLVALALACGGEEFSRPAQGLLEAAFVEASDLFAVPVPVLKAVGHVETRWFHQPHLRSLDGGFGLMHLTEGAGGTLRRAAALTGLDEEALKADPRANILGAAAVLRADFDEQRVADPGLSALDPADFWGALQAYPGIPDPEVARLYVELVYTAMLNGAERVLPDGERLALPATPVNLSRRPALGQQRFALTPDYPGARWVAAHPSNQTAGRGGNAINYVIVHTTQGSYAGCVSWFQNPASNVSAHYVIPQNPLSPPLTQMVENQNTGWHAGNWSYNQRSIGLEHEGWVADPGWATENTYCVSAKLTRWLCDTYRFPCDRAHVIGHVEIPGATHTDPGKHWNWTKYMAYVSGGCGAAPGTGTLIGVVYRDPDVNSRIPGAAVRLNTGASTVSDGSGTYQFAGLTAGSYTATASAAGFRDNAATRTVGAGQTVWGSIGLFSDEGKGRFKGFVYEGQDPKVNHLDGVEVRLDAGAWRAAKDKELQGYFEFDAAPGVRTVSARKTGYVDNASTRTVVAGADVWGSIPLTRTTAVVPPKVHIDAPKDKTVLEIADVGIRGSIENAGGVDTVTIRFAGREVPGPVTLGAFLVPITVPPGETVVEAVASNAAGEGRASITLTFKTGLCGFVFEQEFEGSGGEASRLAGAEVSLFGEDFCGSPSAVATTGADGSFCLDAPAGSYTLKTAAKDHRTAWERVEVPANRRERTRTGLALGADPVPRITIVRPELDEDGRFETTASTVDVLGGVFGLEPSAATVGGRAADLSADGSFAALAVPLPEGDSSLEVVARGHCGESARRTMTARRIALPPAPEGGACGCGASNGGASLPGLMALFFLGRRRRSPGTR